MILKEPISILSYFGYTPEGALNSKKAKYFKQSSLEAKIVRKDKILGGHLPDKVESKILEIRKRDSRFQHLDKSVILAMLSAQKALQNAAWHSLDHIGINIGSSRGATRLFEKSFRLFESKKESLPWTSPNTTLGNISSWVAQFLNVDGIHFSHSITCSTSSHSILNGIAWLKSGLSNRFLVGGSEACLTPYTISQFEAMRIYSTEKGKYPCTPFGLEKNNMVIGEGSGIISLENGTNTRAIAEIIGIGFFTEKIKSNSSICDQGEALQKSMKMAIENHDKNDIDLIIAHAPGTKKGDKGEWNAINKIFEGNVPLISSNKWIIGHTFGASGVLNLIFGIEMLRYQKFIDLPYTDINHRKDKTKPIRKVLINSMGFGGNATSILVQSPKAIP